MDYSPLASLSMGFPRQEYWSGFAIPSSRGSSQPREHICVCCVAGRLFFTTEPPVPYKHGSVCVLIGKMLGSIARLKRPGFEMKHFSLELCDSGASAYIAF